VRPRCLALLYAFAITFDGLIRCIPAFSKCLDSPLFTARVAVEMRQSGSTGLATAHIERDLQALYRKGAYTVELCV